MANSAVVISPGSESRNKIISHYMELSVVHK